MKTLLHTRVVRLLMLLSVWSKGGSAESRETRWVRDPSLDGLTSNTGALWVQEESMSGIDCAMTCADSDGCVAVFYNSRTQQCQGHSEAVTVSGTTQKPDNAFYSKVTIPVSSTPTTPPVHFKSVSPPMEYDVYVSGPKTWYDAEATCDGLGQRLIRLDTEAKVNTLIGVLGIYPATMSKDVYVGGIGCCYVTKIYWHSGQQDFWKLQAAGIPFISTMVYKVNSANPSAGLQLHLPPTDSNLFVCETIP